MGDRANVAVKVRHGAKVNEPGACVVFYTHWRGTEVPDSVARGLLQGKKRWSDPPYLARIIFDWIENGDDGETGFSIDTDVGDNEHHLLVVDPQEKKVLMYSRQSARESVLNTDTPTVPVKEWTFDEFVKMVPEDDEASLEWSALTGEEDGGE